MYTYKYIQTCVNSHAYLYIHLNMCKSVQNCSMDIYIYLKKFKSALMLPVYIYIYLNMWRNTLACSMNTYIYT